MLRLRPAANFIASAPLGARGDLYTVNADGTDLIQATHDGDVDVAEWGTHPLATG